MLARCRRNKRLSRVSTTHALVRVDACGRCDWRWREHESSDLDELQRDYAAQREACCWCVSSSSNVQQQEAQTAEL